MEANKEQLFNFNRNIFLKRNVPCLVDESAIMLKLSAFTIRSQLGKGTFGTVYEASTDVLKHTKIVALKLLKAVKIASDAMGEVQALIRLKSYHVVDCLGAFFDHLPVIILEKANCDIYEYQPTEREAFIIFEDLLKGLQFIHDEGYLHCDLKPANLLVINGRAKLSDLGTVTKYDKETQWLELSRIKCTFAYAPSITLNTMQVNRWTDIYSIAVSIWECLARQRFLTPRGKWFTDCILKPQDEITFYQIALKDGKFKEEAPEYNPIMNPLFKAEVKGSINFSIVLSNPGWFKVMALEDRVGLKLPNKEWKDLLLSIMDLKEESKTVRLAGADSIYAIDQYKRLRSKLLLADSSFNVLMHKGPTSNLKNNQVKPVLRLTTPALNLETSNLAYNFYYINPRESCFQRKRENPEMQRKKSDYPNQHPKSGKIMSDMKIADVSAQYKMGEINAGRNKTKGNDETCNLTQRKPAWTTKTVEKGLQGVKGGKGSDMGKAGPPIAGTSKQVTEKKTRRTRRERPERRNTKVTWQGKCRYKCGTCGKLYSQPGGLTRHKLKHKPGKKKFICIHCKEVFARCDVYRVHKTKCKCNPAIKDVKRKPPLIEKTFEDSMEETGDEGETFDQDNEEGYISSSRSDFEEV